MSDTSSITSAAGTDTAASPQSEPAPRRPILLVGDDLGWLAGRRELAGRRIIVGDPQADALALLAAEPLDGVVYEEI